MLRRRMLQALSLFMFLCVFFLVRPLHSHANPTSSVSRAYFGMHVSSSVYQPWPSVEFGTIRTWDLWPNVTWASISPQADVYNWNILDQLVEQSITKNVDIIYTFGVTPSWASIKPAGSGCAYGNGTCFSPLIQAWKTFVSKLTDRYKGKIKYYELWNEPNEPKYWSGTTQDMVSLASAAYPIIRAAGGTVLSPAPQGVNAYKWLSSYFLAGGNYYSDVIAFHGYVYGAPEKIIDVIANIRKVASNYENLTSTPVWDTENSWGDPTWPFGATQDQQAAWLARFLPLSFANGIERSVWYKWDGYDGHELWGTLFNATQKKLQTPGVAYRAIYDWLIGATMNECSVSGNLYQCVITKPGGYEGRLAWAATADSTFTEPFVAPSRYTRYRCLDGTMTLLPSDKVVRLGMKPILLE